MKYFPIQKKWAKIKPFINDKEVQKVLVRDFNKFTYGRWHQEFKAGMKPTEFESCDWRCNTGKRGRQPEYWDYVKHAACHWLVNFNLKLAMLVEPTKQWRIVTSDNHSTVWDGEDTLFDFNFSALGVDVNEAWTLADQDGRHLKPGKQMRVYYSEWCELQHAKPQQSILN